ncbi:TPA: hypothetical protein DEP58_03160 [Patescibacteria group bacterium]|nr:hypothetical protein [Patescibacteria group bacterium]
MAYTNNPQAPKVRRDAALFAKRHGIRTAARRFGVSPGTITKWVRKLERYGIHPIPTRSSRPRSHPKRIPRILEDKIAQKRLTIRRSAEVVHKELENEGVIVSLSTVKRTLSRRLLLNKRSPWKRVHLSIPRPDVKTAGDLVQIDTIHLIRSDGSRVYVFTLLDVHSRFAYARAYERANTHSAISFVRRAQAHAPFQFHVLQSDNGPEWSTHFTNHIRITHRHTRVRRPNDNAHLERFNRTIQEECIKNTSRTVSELNKVLVPYLRYYNEKRLHFGIDLQTPRQLLAKCFQGID